MLKARGAISIDDTPVEGSLGLAISELQEALSLYNEAMSRFKHNAISRLDYTYDDPRPDKYTVELSPRSSIGDIKLTSGPYPTYEDFIQVGNIRVHIPNPVAVTRSTSPITSQSISGGIKLHILSIDGKWSRSLFFDSLSLDSIVEEIGQECYGRAVVTESGGIIEILGEPGTICIQVTGVVAKVLGFPSKVNSLKSGSYLPTSEVAHILGGEAKNSTIYSGEISQSSGEVALNLDVERAIVATSYGRYVLEGGVLVPYTTVTPISDLPPTFKCVISTESVLLKGMSGEVDASPSLGAVKNIASTSFEPNIDVLEGDILDIGEGISVISSTSTELRLSSPVNGGEYSFSCPMYSTAAYLEGALSALPNIGTAPTTYSEALSYYSDIRELSTIIDAQSAILQEAPTPKIDHSLVASVAKIRSTHLDLGYDRAWHLLSKGDLSTYFNLSESESNFVSYVSLQVNIVAPNVRAL